MIGLRQYAQTPENLIFLLNEGTKGLSLDEKLAEHIEFPDDYRIMSKEKIEQGYEEERKTLSSLKYSMIASLKVLIINLWQMN